MATVSVARPAQALRQRDRAPRPNLGKRSTVADGSSDAPAKKRKVMEPFVRTSDYVLQKHKGKAPSMIIHLHDTFFRFDGQEGSWAYSGPMKVIIEHLRYGTIPHDMMEEMLLQNVTFYDGCLIVEVRNHKTKDGREKGRQNATAAEGGADGKFSMHQYNEHITPSPLVPYPSVAREEESPDKAKASGSETLAMDTKGKTKETDNAGPKSFMVVLHPTALTQHHEMRMLANTPATDLRSKKKSGESGAHASALPPQTPQLSVPPTPITTSRGALSQPQQMCLEQGDFYTFQAQVLMLTEPPLFLEPVRTAGEAERVLEMLADPRHSQKPPSAKSRKRTTAEMAADDAQAAEAERRMLIMDERIKPSARTGANTGANENQGAAAALGFSRFKTLEMVRQKHEEQERIRKDEEHRTNQEKKQHDEQVAAHNATQQAAKQALQARQNRDRESMLMAQQQISNRNLTQQRNEQLQIQRVEQQRHAQIARDHAHPPQQSPLVPNPQQTSFQQNAMVQQSSPVLQQQTPMMNSSPMMHNGGFPMAPTSSQGAGSPRPNSAAVQNRHVSMVRQISQPQHGSQNGTPHLQQGTPSMGHLVPNRQMTQTPRMPQSPASGMMGTPTSNTMHHMQPRSSISQPSNLTPEQQLMLHQQAMRNQHTAIQAGSPAGPQAMQQNMTPDQIQQIRAQQMQVHQRAQQQQALMAAQAANPQAYAAQVARQRQLRQMQAMSQAGSPGAQQMYAQATPQAGHAHPGLQQTPNPQHQMMPANGMPQQHLQQNGGQASAEQLAMAQARSQQMALQRQTQMQLSQTAQQFGGWQNIPAHVVPTLTPNVQQLLKQHHLRQAHVRQQQQQQMRAQQMAQQQQNGGVPGSVGVDGQQVVPGQANPQYMQALRTNQQMLALQMAQHSQMSNGTGGMAGTPNMGMNMGMGQPGQQHQQQNNLDQHFANMQNALNQGQQRGPSQGGNGPQQQQPGMQ